MTTLAHETPNLVDVHSTFDPALGYTWPRTPKRIQPAGFDL